LKYQVTHITHYQYTELVNICFNEGWLIPKDTPNQNCIKYDLTIQPNPFDLEIRTDFYKNQTCSFSLHVPHQQLLVSSKSIVEINSNTFDREQAAIISLESSELLLHNFSEAILEAREFMLPSTMIPFSAEIRAYALPSFEAKNSLFEACFDLMQRIYKDFKFVSGYTTISTPISDVLEEKKGVCQDFAHLAIACIRSMGFPARYVSGYIETLPPKGKEKLVGADASHAWFSVYIPTIGWIDFDPTNNMIPSHQHIVVAHGRDYSDIPPLKGVVFNSGTQKLNVSVDVRKIYG
jgi:transglutaminase-like putative cysteine protease